MIHYWIYYLTKTNIIILFFNCQDTRILMFWFCVIQLVHCNVSGLFPCPGLFSFSVSKDDMTCPDRTFYILAFLCFVWTSRCILFIISFVFLNVRMLWFVQIVLFMLIQVFWYWTITTVVFPILVLGFSYLTDELDVDIAHIFSFFVLSYCVSLRSEFRVVMSVTISI